MIDGVGERLAPRVGGKHGEAPAEAPFELRLKRIVVRNADILEVLNVATQSQGIQGPKADHWRSGGVEGERIRVQVSKCGKLQAPVPHIRRVEHKLAGQLAL